MTAGRHLPKLTRDALFLILGTAGAAWQLFFVHPTDAAALAFCGLLLGLPAYLRVDEKRREQDK